MMPSAPPYAFDNDDDEARVMDYYSSGNTATPSRFAPPPRHNEDDEAMARALQQQEQDAAFARSMQDQMGRESHLRQSAATQEQDVEYALQVEQQLRDEELARQYALAEEQALQQRQQQAQQAQAATTAGQSTRRRMWSCIIPLLIVGAGVAVWLVVANNTNTNVSLPGLGGGDGNGGGGIPWLWDNDPFEGLQPGEVARWRNPGNQGLQLTVLNAMETTWDDVFPLVLNDWDNGIPDTLALTVENTDVPDPDCSVVMGISKVCNGNYGNTQWKGINQVILQNGYIAASNSKMNEYYLLDASTSQRRYTLCHEIGHSFGLPHTDENFYNRDLGNCMDYTSNPKANQQPDETNFQFLKDLYGVLPGRGDPSTAAPTEDPDDGNRRRLNDNDDMPDHIKRRIQEAKEHHQYSSRELQRQGWRLLHTSQHGQAHELDLGDGWSMQLHKLFS